MNKKRAIGTGIAICGAVIGGWYCYEHSQWFEVSGHPSIVRMKVDGNRLRIVLQTASDLPTYVDLSAFDAFRKPVTNLRDAVSYYGEPDNIYTDPESKTENIEYWRGFGRVALYRNRHYGGTSNGVRIYLTPVESANILRDPVVQYLEQPNAETVVVFSDRKGRLLLLTRIEGSRVDWIDWAELGATYPHDEPDRYVHIP